MESFLQKLGPAVIGWLSGFDRLVLRGMLRSLSYADGLRSYLNRHEVLLTEFGAFAEGLTKCLKESSLDVATRQNRPTRYLVRVRRVPCEGKAERPSES